MVTSHYELVTQNLTMGIPPTLSFPMELSLRQRGGSNLVTAPSTSISKRNTLAWTFGLYFRTLITC